MLIVGVCCLALSYGACRGREHRDSRPPVFLFTVDALRADHLPIYGYDRDTAPELTAFASDAVVFTRAFTTAPKTTPAYASMFTGRYPHRHGLQVLGQELAEENLTLAELLRERGYATAGFVSSTVMVDRLSSLGQGFHHWDDRLPSREANRENYERTASLTAGAVLDWLARADLPPFLFVHLIDPHGPYLPPPMFRARFRFRKGPEIDPAEVPDFQRLPNAIVVGDYVDAYDAEILYADSAFRRMLNDVRERGLYDRALIVFTADHGESLGEDGYYFRHGKTLHEVSTRIPLVVKPPGGRGEHIDSVWDDAVSLIDVMPTVLEYVGVKVPPGTDGRSLRPILEGQARPSERVVFSQRHGSKSGHWAAHSARGTVYLTDCNDTMVEECADTYLAKRGDGSTLELSRKTETREALRAELQRHIEAVTAYRLPCPVTWRYRPANKEFVRQFVTEHNTRWETFTERDLDALERLGYTD